MSILRATLAQIVGLFVSDWTQTAGIAVILGLGFVGSRWLHAVPVGFLLALLLASHLVFTTVTEARRLAHGQP